MKIKTTTLIDVALDWAVAHAMQYVTHDDLGWTVTLPVPSEPPTTTPPLPFPKNFSPSTRWAQAGPIIERERINLEIHDLGDTRASFYRPRLTHDGRAKHYHHEHGPTPLIAAMRCYVASKLGDEVDVPDEFVEVKP